MNERICISILMTWNLNFNFKYFQVIRVEKQIRSFVLWVKLLPEDLTLRSTDFNLCKVFQRFLFVSSLVLGPVQFFYLSLLQFKFRLATCDPSQTSRRCLLLKILWNFESLRLVLSVSLQWQEGNGWAFVRSLNYWTKQ